MYNDGLRVFRTHLHTQLTGWVRAQVVLTNLRVDIPRCSWSPEMYTLSCARARLLLPVAESQVASMMPDMTRYALLCLAQNATCTICSAVQICGLLVVAVTTCIMNDTRCIMLDKCTEGTSQNAAAQSTACLQYSADLHALYQEDRIPLLLPPPMS